MALNDSPIGLLAWIVDKVHIWSDCRPPCFGSTGPKHGDTDTNRGAHAHAHAHVQSSTALRPILTTNNASSRHNATPAPRHPQHPSTLHEWERAIPRDCLLLNVTIYWLTQCASSSLRLYYTELGKHPFHHTLVARDGLLSTGPYCPVPTGVLCGAAEIIQPPHAWATLCFNLKHWRNGRDCVGGHFFAWENPETLAMDMKDFFHRNGNFDLGRRMRIQRGTLRPRTVLYNTLLGAGIVGILTWWAGLADDVVQILVS